jgi:hypothetical protein
VISDRGPQFVVDFTHELYRLIGIKLATLTAYHPQTDGQTERVNQELEQFLRLFVNQRQDDWEELLALGKFQYNNHVHSSTQQTPFMVDSGRHPRMGFEPQEPRLKLASVNDFVDRMSKGLEKAKSVLSKAKDEYTLYYNRCCEPAPELQPGDLVWVDAADISTDRPSVKLAHCRLGPYPIDVRVGHGAYCLKLPPSLSQLHPVFPIVKLTLATPDPIVGRRARPPPPPVLVEGKEEHEVETILDSRMRWNRLEYLIKWKGYNIGDNTWVVHRDVHVPDIIAEFHRLNPGAPRHINAASFNYIAFSHADAADSWRSRRVEALRP